MWLTVRSSKKHRATFQGLVITVGSLLSLNTREEDDNRQCEFADHSDRILKFESGRGTAERFAWL